MRYIKAIYIGLIGMLLAGCQADQWEGIEGGFQITLSDEATVTTKSTPAELGEPTTDKFNLKIVNEATNNAAYDGAYKSGTIPAPAGTYTITATFGENPVLALDDPYYKGDTTGVKVEEGQTASITLNCKVANALASVVFPDATEMAKIYQSYWVKVAVESYSTKLEPNSTKSAYFQAGKEVAFYFEGTKLNGQSVSAKLEHDNLPATFEAADHYTLTLTFNDDLTLDISKVEATTVTINETIPMEWLPKPKVEAEGFEGNELSFVETENKTASIKLVTATALQDLKLKFDFQDEQFQSSLQTNKEYLLSNTDDRQTIESALDITFPEIGTTDAILDLSPLLDKLQTNAGVLTRNSIEIDVKANNRWSSEDQEANRTYTLICNKPEFSVSVQEENCWSREFTIDEVTVTSGNVDIIKNNLVYQYYNYNEQEWIDCATRENIKGRTQQFTEAAEDLTTKEYKVRALYRGAIASSEVVTATLETPTQLPNGNMDEWSYETYIKDGGWFSSDETFYSFNPWKNGDNPFWDTNNDFTTRHRNNTNANIYPYNGFHAVSSVQGKSSGLAAELRSTANGRGNNQITGEADYNKVAGELFIGSAKVKMGTSGMFGDADGSKDTYEREKNATFTNRPSALKFWYKYIPYNSDTWSAHIELLDETKNIIVQQDFTSSETKNDWTEAIVSLDYNEGTLYAKCKYIYVIFCSTTNPGANMPYREITQTFYIDGQEKTFSLAYVGSVLTIDDISLVYDK